MDTILDGFISPISTFIENKFILFLLGLIFAVGSIFYIKHKAKSGFSLSDRFWNYWTGHKCESSNVLLKDKEI